MPYVRPLPSNDLLQASFLFCPVEGTLTKRKTGNVMRAVQKQGYIVCRFKGEIYLAHRLCWALYHGFDPEHFQVDHINGIRSDNRISNLRLATPRLNGANKKKKPGCSSSYKGVYRRSDTGKYVAQMRVSGVRKKIGSFNSELEAAAAYNAAARQEFGEYARINKGVAP